MCEVTLNNFNDILPELQKVLKDARFISIDTEFSCLHASHKLQNSIFDSGSKRYEKLRATVQQMIPLQIGLTAYTFDADNNLYTAHIYTFYIFPTSFAFMDVKFLCQSSSLQFLSIHKFDFNKLVKEGISYLNRSQEADLIKMMKSNDFGVSDSSMSAETENLLKECVEVITKWFSKAKIDEICILQNVEVYKKCLDVKYFLHKNLRCNFKPLWTYEDSEGFKVKKVTMEQYVILNRENNLDNIFISNLLGFSTIFRLLTSLNKPIIGHNLMLDIMVMIHSFEQPLPKSYSAFKKLVQSLFPIVFDTKSISFEISSLIPEPKRWRQNSLRSLYEYFKDGHGRHLAANSPLIESTEQGLQNFHYAGWDSYCTGYIFIRMAHIYAAHNCVRKKKFMTCELLQAVDRFKNNINIIRGDVSHILLDGNDPVSRRPPWLIIETYQNKRINIRQVQRLLSSYGYIEVRPHFFKGNSAIIAVDNFGSARRILAKFKSHSDFRIQQYSVLKHSPMATVVLWSGIIASGVFLAWYGYKRV